MKNTTHNKDGNCNANASSRLRRTFYVAAAAATTFAHHQVNAFTQPDHHYNRPQSTIMEMHDTRLNVATPLSDHISTNDALPIMQEAANVANALNMKANTNAAVKVNDKANWDGLSEFSFTSLYPNSSKDCTAGTGADALSMSTVSEEQQEFDMMIGRALDTIRSDYPDILTKDPDFSIYDPHLEVVDPKGITLHSLNSYKTSFQFLHILIKLLYCPEKSGLTFRLVYDCARKSIRVSWNAELKPRVGGGTLHVDGISVYEFDRKSGLINQHRVEHLLINDAPVEAPQGIFSAIAKNAMAGPDAEGVPVWNLKHEQSIGGVSGNASSNGRKLMSNVLEFVPSSPFKSSTSLFSSAADDEFLKHPLFDQDAFDKKNASRKRFGVKPLTPNEFVEIEAQVKAMASAQATKQQRQQQDAAAAAQVAKQKESRGNFLNKMFGNILQDTCESNYDCERPEVCCDLGFKKMCCSSGARVFDLQPQLQQIPLRVIADDGQMPRGGPDGMDNLY